MAERNPNFGVAPDSPTPLSCNQNTIYPGDCLGVLGETRYYVRETHQHSDTPGVVVDSHEGETEFLPRDTVERRLARDFYHWRALGEETHTFDEPAPETYAFYIYAVELPHSFNPGDFSIALGRGRCADTELPADPYIESWDAYGLFDTLVENLFDRPADGSLDDIDLWVADKPELTDALNDLVNTAEQRLHHRFDLTFDEPSLDAPVY